MDVQAVELEVILVLKVFVDLQEDWLSPWMRNLLMATTNISIVPELEVSGRWRSTVEK